MNLKIELLFVLLFPFFSCGSNEQTQLSAPEIPVYQTNGQDIPIYQDFIGQVYGYKDIAIRARVEGFLEGIHFKEGSEVNRNKLLYTLESQPYEADVAAKMSKVAEAKTTLAKAQSDLNRIRPLAEQKAVSESDLDAAVALYDASIASVEAAEANLRASRIQLSYTRIHSPLSGIIGKTKAKVGDFVGRSPNPVILNVVSRIDTILVQFFITEAQYLQLANHAKFLRENPDIERDEAEFELLLADGSRYPYKGKFDFADREIDPTTGAMLIQSSFSNPDYILRPGQYAKVVVEIDVVENGIMIPQRCIMELQGLYSVFIVNENNKVEQRRVTAGPKISDFWLIKNGLEIGEKVVYEGLQKVREGMTVDPHVKEISPAKNEGL
jgi:membrane fusion protein (multidrug efflux system)